MTKLACLLLALTSCADDATSPLDDAPPTPTPNCTDGVETEDVAFTVRSLHTDGTTETVPVPIDVTHSGCAVATTGVGGRGTATISTAPHSVSLSGAGYATSIYPVRPIAEASNYLVMTREIATAAPGYSTEDGNILVIIGGASAGPCGRHDNVTVAIKDHPELHPMYFANGTQIATSATSTTPFGVASFANVPPGAMYEVITSKPGCPTSAPEPVPAEAGAISIVDATVSSPTCGAGPYVQMLGTASRRATDFTATPLPDVELSFSACPGVTTTSGSDGRFQIQMTRDTPFSTTLAKAGFLSYRAQELSFSTNVDGGFALRGEEWKAQMPGWTDQGVTIVAALGSTGANECGVPDGVSFAVRNHPEAVIHYIDTSIPPQEAIGATTTSTRGYAEITGLAPGRYQIDATTAKNCKFGPVGGGTGFVDAVAGFENFHITILTNP